MAASATPAATPIPLGCVFLNGSVVCEGGGSEGSDAALGWEITLVAVCGLVVAVAALLTYCKRRMKTREEARKKIERELQPSLAAPLAPPSQQVPHAQRAPLKASEPIDTSLL